MNKFLKISLFIVILLTNFICFAKNDTKKTGDILSCEIFPKKEVYYVGETVSVRFELVLAEENSEIHNGTININGLNNVPYISTEKIKQLNANHDRGYAFSKTITFIDSGNYIITPAVFYTKAVRTSHRGFFSSMIEFENTETFSNQIHIQISEPPIHAGDFCGIIGSAEIFSKISTNNIETGDIIIIKTYVETSNYMKDKFIPPSIIDIEGFKIYPPKIIETKQEDGSIYFVIEQMIVANKDGIFTIPAPVLTYFDSIDGAYKNISENKPLNITVRKRNIEEENTVVIPITGINSDTDTPNDSTYTLNPEGSSTTHLKTSSNTIAKLAPSTTALTIFEIPANSDIIILEQHGSWYRVLFNDTFVWIPISATIGEK